ncbi:riboflavin synthase [Asaia krungthepensis]|uniref:Riboflavin synthase n=1 Tax=Asaia krungthepensis NRIC 0535 TaxID=1307925 RepID=A0ABQ0PVP8_9PROT|nr:riboflavin synthase [Asaia krungthepensis]GBQ82776.1 riboflavin synthase subunit alpha [Asaia krungthepensis NRIC 0535]
MFSGIIEHIGRIRTVETRDQAILLQVETGLSDMDLGESIAVNGVCLTVAAYDSTGLADFFVSAETLSRTALGRLSDGARVNLERASTPATRLSGHIVQGHVDGLAHLVSVSPVGESRHIVFRLPAALRGYVVEKGSIALDGVSLTVNEVSDVEGEAFTIALMIIPHTWDHTGLSEISPGDPANVEVDVLAKYVESLLKYGVRS